MPRVVQNRLTARTVASLKDGVFADGGNLWLTVKGNTRAWSVRYTSPTNGRVREMGIGSAREISLSAARERAADARRLIGEGIDPIDARQQARAANRKERGLTFAEAAERFMAERAPTWKSARAQPLRSGILRIHICPVIGKKPVAAVDTDDALSVLRPIWTSKPETAGRARWLIENILDYAKIHKWREGENPARWRGHLSNVLPRPSAIAKVEHRPAVDRKHIGEVMGKLVESQGMAARAVRFVCLTAARSGEVRGALWSEIDLEAKMWIVPAERMKMAREHRVPLSESALDVLREALPLRDQKAGDLVFPGQKRGKPLSDVALSKALHAAAGTKDVTVHGLRSTFRDWAAEETDHPGEVAEMALAHAIGSKVEAAYRRGDLIQKRAEMMAAWAAYCIPLRE
ncbi:tyrosine-type recombinase/integrase [Nguyenibacter vanlangensis]|uniref:Tyrosine-type recombinase/integrase n=1 Tax=Nguyenibacter vanlangensis TaxID=1216886 RepID=A0A7Y7M557_9PROT|nr:site-specific integrase [Nguyenibacter vanlangensis]NVN10657.1 tyrosine-type recombinase/integrase [Nguyenibacter vanlangensis]